MSSLTITNLPQELATVADLSNVTGKGSLHLIARGTHYSKVSAKIRFLSPRLVTIGGVKYKQYRMNRWLTRTITETSTWSRYVRVGINEGQMVA